MLNWRPLLVALCSLATLAATPPSAYAQLPLGRVDDVRRLLSCRPATSVTDPESQSVVINRDRSSRISAIVGADVRVGDTVIVRRMIDVHVFADSLRGFGSGYFVFAPELGACTSYDELIRKRGRALTGTSPGRYVIASRKETVNGRDASRLIMSIEYGGLVANWTGGLLSFIALGREIRITGTRLAVAVDSAAGEVFVAVLEGTVQIISLGGGAITRVSGGQVARVPAISGNIVVTPMAPDVVGNLTYHLDDVWRVAVEPPRPTTTPGGRGTGPSVGKVIGRVAIGVGLAATGWYAYDRWIRKDPVNSRRSGTIILQIPL